MSEDNGINGSGDLPRSSAPPPPEIGRRRVIGWMLGLGGAAVAGLLSVPLIRMAFYPLFAQSSQSEWTDAGPVSAYESLQTPVRCMLKIEATDGWQQNVSEKVVYVTKSPDGSVTVLSAVCPHLGCEVSWHNEKNEFLCPCHGSVFSPDGARIAGPAPRAMDSLPERVLNGRLMVRYEYFRNLLTRKEVVG